MRIIETDLYKKADSISSEPTQPGLTDDSPKRNMIHDMLDLGGGWAGGKKPEITKMKRKHWYKGVPKTIVQER